VKQAIEGSYDYDTATRIARGLSLAFAIVPKVLRMRTIDGKSTDWYQVFVHKKWIIRAQDFVCGWKIGNEAGLDRAYGRDELAAVGNVSRAIATLGNKQRKAES
jgi:hypothetical protein